MLFSGYTFNTLASFDATNGPSPLGDVTLDAAGNLYGTTTSGGAAGFGTVFELAKGSGTITTLASFNGTDGIAPNGGMAIDANGDLFGTTFGGSTFDDGTIFEIVKGSGTITTLATFNSANGASPSGRLTRDSAGNLFGVAESGGAAGNGAVFEFDSGTGQLTDLASFNGNNGATPTGGVTFDAAGDIFGTAVGGSVNPNGVVFEVARGSNTIVDLASFNGSNGASPAGVVLDGAGNLFGAAGRGGASGNGAIYEVVRGSGTITDLASFNGADGDQPQGDGGNLILDGNGNLFGTTFGGGIGFNPQMEQEGHGTIFEIAAGSGTITDLAFLSSGVGPDGGMAVDAAGNFFGLTESGGSNFDGTVFELTPPAAPAPIDTSFGTGGAVKLPFVAEAQSPESDGSLVIAGHMGDPSANAEQAVCEILNADGSPNTGFGTGGMVTTPAGTNASFLATLPLSDGSVICVGQIGSSAFAAKALANGTLDPTFGSGGAATPALGAGSALYSIVAGPNGTVYVAGVAGGGLPVVARLTAAGALDPTFGTGGFTTINTGTTGNAIGGLVVQSDGKIVAVGAAGSGVDVFRLNADGTADATFGTAGVAVVPGLATAQVANNAPDVTEGLALQADGGILVANTTTAGDFGLVRLNDDGTPDDTFGNSGTGLVTTDFGGLDDADSVLVDPHTHQILVTGTTDAGSGTLQVAVAAYLPDGTLDPTFGNGTGMTTVPTNVAPLSRAYFLGSFTQLRASAALQPGSTARRLIVGSSGGPQNTSSLQRLILPASISDDSLLRPTVSGRLPVTPLIAGRKIGPITQSVRLTNSGSTTMAGPMTLELLLSSSPAGNGSDPVLATINRRINLRPGRSVTFALTARSIPAGASSGAKFIVAVVDDPNGVTGVGASANTVDVEQPVIDLGGAFVRVPASARAGRRAVVTISVSQDGNVPVTAPLTVQLLASPNADGSGATDLGTVTRRVTVPAGRTIRLSLPVTLPQTPGTPVFLVAVLDPANTLGDADLSNNTFVSATAITLV